MRTDYWQTEFSALQCAQTAQVRGVTLLQEAYENWLRA